MTDQATRPAEPTADAPPVVEARKVTKAFNVGTDKETVAIRDVSFVVEDKPGHGECVAIIGPSGCGKSTLLNLVAGFHTHLPPTSGELLVRGRPITGPGRDRGMIFQKYSSFPNRSVLRNVMFGLELHKKSLGLSKKAMEDKALEWIAKVGLEGHEHKYPHQLSGGQQQRVAIARTLILSPEIILMDEPFSALDEPTRIEMQRLLVALWHESEATIFIITHSIAEAVYLADRVWIMTKGPGTIATEITDALPPVAGEDPLQVQESAPFKEALAVVSDEFQRVTEAAPRWRAELLPGGV